VRSILVDAGRLIARFYRWVAAGGVVVHEVPQEVLGRIIELVEKVGDRPMDLADATLVAAAEALGTKGIV